MKTLLFTISQILTIRQTLILSALYYTFFQKRKEDRSNFKNINYLSISAIWVKTFTWIFLFIKNGGDKKWILGSLLKRKLILG